MCSVHLVRESLTDRGQELPISSVANYWLRRKLKRAMHRTTVFVVMTGLSPTRHNRDMALATILRPRYVLDQEIMFLND
jgi:hypothetical protein